MSQLSSHTASNNSCLFSSVFVFIQAESTYSTEAVCLSDWDLLLGWIVLYCTDCTYNICVCMCSFVGIGDRRPHSGEHRWWQHSDIVVWNSRPACYPSGCSWELYIKVTNMCLNVKVDCLIDTVTIKGTIMLLLILCTLIVLVLLLDFSKLDPQMSTQSLWAKILFLTVVSSWHQVGTEQEALARGQPIRRK